MRRVNINKKLITSLRRAMALALAGCLTLPAWGCSFSQDKIYTSTIFAMDTVMELQIAGERDYTPEAEQYIRDLEKKLSVTDDGSEVALLNSKGEAALSQEPGNILERAFDVCKRTDGALDISIYPVLRAWGFTTGDYRVPTDDEIAELLQNVDYSRIVIEKESPAAAENGSTYDSSAYVKLPDGMQIDLGSVAKGYTGTAVTDMLREKGVTHALINLGGNVQCIGGRPDGKPWKVAIKSPFQDSASGVIGVVDADDVAIITSGGYERYFEEGGNTYWHILDPETGKPAESGLVSVTIIGKDGLLCDGLSTAFFVKGLDRAIEHYKVSDDFDAIFVTDDRQIYITEGISDVFSLSSEYHDIPVHVISK